MEDVININEYVRTEEGYIGKLVEYIPNALNYLKIDIGREIKHCDDSIDNFIYTRYGFQLKHSKNIIDLIEVGDYVNGYRVIDIVKGFKVIIDKLELDTTTGTYKNIGIKDIKSILAHELFKEMEYKV